MIFMLLNQMRALQLKNIFTQPMHSKHSLMGVEQFRNLQEVPSNPDDLRYSYLNSELKPCDEPTGYCKVPSILDFLHSSTLQEGARDYQISFEDNFMDEHENALRKQLENFMESSFKNGDTEKITFESSEMFKEELEFEPFKTEDDILMNFQNKNSFITEIQKQKKLQKFFEFVFETVPKKPAEEILYVASVGFADWEKRLKNKLQFSNELEVVTEAKKLTSQKFQKLYEDERINFLNLKRVSPEELNQAQVLERSFKGLIESIFATTGLIFLGFFGNPYMESEETKRFRGFRLEDDEDQDSSSSTYNQLGAPKKRFH